MDVYIDLIYLVNVILGCLCLLSLSVLTGKMQGLPKIIGLSLLWGGHIVTLYMTEMMYYGWVVFICFLFERKHLVKNTLIFLFVHETFMNSLSGIYRIGHVLVITDNFNWFLPFLIGIIILFIYLGTWFQFRKEALHQSLFYDVTIKVEDQLFYYRGFMDTGNQALHNGVPIIFVKQASFLQTQTVAVQRTSNINHFIGTNGMILFNDQWYPCFLALLENLDVEADCLLNYYLL